MTTASSVGRAVPAFAFDRAAAGDEAAFAELVDAYHNDLRRVAYVVCGDRELAEDAAQQAWVIAWRRLSTVREPASLRAWLVAIAANEGRKLAARGRQRIALEGHVRPLTAANDPAEAGPTLDLESALRRLSPDDRALLALRYVAGLDSTEISHLRGGSASGIRARLGRLLGRLRTELDDA